LFRSIRKLTLDHHAPRLHRRSQIRHRGLKIRGTPTFFVNGEMLQGVPDFEEFDKKIKSLLKS
jgi:glutaredoxin